MKDFQVAVYIRDLKLYSEKINDALAEVYSIFRTWLRCTFVG